MSFHFSPFLIESDNNLYEIHSARRDALSKWLSNVTADQIESEIQTQLQVATAFLFVKKKIKVFSGIQYTRETFSPKNIKGAVTQEHVMVHFDSPKS